jgi:hypothetical protein
MKKVVIFFVLIFTGFLPSVLQVQGGKWEVAKQWIKTDSLNFARNETAAAVWNNKIYLAGGPGSIHSKSLNNTGKGYFSNSLSLFVRSSPIRFLPMIIPFLSRSRFEGIERIPYCFAAALFHPWRSDS